MIVNRILFLITLFLGLCANISAQNAKIILGPDKIALNQAFTITVEVQNNGYW